MAKQWSGLAKAVDAHIHRMRVMQREFAALQLWVEKGQPWTLGEIYDRMPHVGQWIVFSQSYGMPQPDGSVQPGVIVRPHVEEHTGPEAHLAIQEEATISGKEHYGFDRDERRLMFAQMIMHQEVRALEQAVSHYISADVVNMITMAAAEADPEPIFHTDIITPSGFAVLEKPVVLPDLHPDTGEVAPDIKVAVRAFAWFPTEVVSTHADGVRRSGPGVQIIIYSTNEDYRETYVPSYERALGVEHPTKEYGGILFDKLSGEYDFYVLDVLPWAFGSPWALRQGATHQDGMIVPSVAFFRRWFMTLMRFCWQEILVPGTERLDRAAAKRLLRSGKPKRDYTVLRLRRVYVDKSHGEAEAGYGHPLEYRIKVRGHWKRQYYPKLGPARLEDGTWNAGSHRLIWVDPYWKGPEDGELGPEFAATAVVR
jgi:hypothetical protein